MVKHNKVLNEPIDSSKITYLNGIGKELIQTLELVDLDLRVGNVSIPAKLYVVHDDFPI